MAAAVDKARSALTRIFRKRSRVEWVFLASSVARAAGTLFEGIGDDVGSDLYTSQLHKHGLHIGLQHRVLVMWVTRSRRRIGSKHDT